MIMKNKICFALLGALGLALAGCKSHEGAYEPVNTTVYDLENRHRLVLMDKAVQNSVTCSGFQERTNADGRLEVVANVRNRETRRIQVQVSCVFKDEQGFSTGDETPWQNPILTENAQEAVRFVASNDKAKKYTIRVRQAH
jgi:uncharacterized protein YcfL